MFSILRNTFPILIVLSLLSFALPEKEKAPVISKLKFGTITIDGVDYEKDIVIENGEIRQRKKGPSKPYRSKYGHTPLTVHEKIPWDCETLLIGKGMSGRLPITKEFKAMAKEKNVKLIILESPEAVKYYKKHYQKGMNVIIHITC